MQFRIADTFTGSLARLTGEEQKAVKTAAFDLQVNPERPGLSMHKLDGARDPNFWSARAGRDIRIIVHRTGGSLLLCYADHHDKAYKWAERRKLETHPKTGAAQLVEVRETVREIVVPAYIEGAPAKRLPFADAAESDLLACGVPADWLDDVRAADEDGILTLAVEHLPEEAAEAVRGMLAQKEVIMGFGHAIYRKAAPRNAIVKGWAGKLGEQVGDERLFAISCAIEELMWQEKELFANADFFHAAAYHFLGIPTKLFTPIFVCSRVSGWTAHVMEQRANNRIIRPSAEYMGPAPRSMSKLADR